jgi:hypothetical protein
MRLLARIRCRECGVEGSFTFTGFRDCPRCGSRDVRFALRIEELVDNDPVIVSIMRLVEGLRPKTDRMRNSPSRLPTSSEPKE